MDSAPELPSLMARYAHGDSAAATALVQQLSPQLHRFFVTQLLSRSHADDLLQETWLRIHRVRHTFRSGEPLLPWVYAIARNVRADHYRKAYRTERREESLDDHDDFPQASANSPNSPDLESMLGMLPESQREVVFMLKVSGMSLEEVARATSCTVGAVKQKAHRAYETLRKGLTGESGTGGEVYHAG